MSSWELVPHRWVTIKQLPRAVCAGCGLVRLRNALTDWCAAHGCEHDEHPGYRGALAAARQRARQSGWPASPSPRSVS